MYGRIPIEQLLQHARDTAAAEKRVSAQRVERERAEQECKDCTRTFTLESAAAIVALPRDGHLEAQTASTNARNIAPPPTFADMLRLAQQTTPVDALSELQFDALLTRCQHTSLKRWSFCRTVSPLSEFD
jgi:hypothetical protein